MAVVRCERCDRFIDLDWHVEDVIYIDLNSVCTNCASEEEIDAFEKEYYGEGG